MGTDFRRVIVRWGFEHYYGFINTCFDFYGTLGSGVLYHDPGTGASAVVLSSEESRYIIGSNGSSRFFRKEMRGALSSYSPTLKTP